MIHTLFITSWWNELQFIQQFFWLVAILSTVLFVLQAIGNLAGINAETDYDIDLDMDTEVESHFDIDPAFTVFSIRSIIAFFVFFGWTGVILLNQGETTSKVFLTSFITGIIALFFVAYVLYKMTLLSESGNVNLKDLIGKEALVYLTIPANKKEEGLITVTIGNKEMELKAVTGSGEDIKTGEKVIITDVLNQVVLVQRINKQ